MMDSSPKLSGETLIVHHIPLVHCQVSGRRPRGSCDAVSLKRSNPFSSPENLGLSRTTSLPERDVLQREALLYSSLIHTSRGSSSSHTGRERGDRGGGGMMSDDSSFTSSNSEDQLITAHTLPRAKPRNRNPLRHNPFLLNAKDEEDDEGDADDFNSYFEDSSFHLHGDTSPALAPFHLHDLDFASGPFVLHGSVRGSSHESLRGGASDLSTHLEDLDILGLDRQRRHGSSGSNMSMDCGEQDWGDEEDDDDHLMRCGRSSKTGSYSSSSSMQHCSCCVLSHNFPETFSEPCHRGYASDSSCNSSDGVLVNFSAIYNKMNNGVPERPPVSTRANLNSSTDPDYSRTAPTSDPAGKLPDSGGGAFYLDLHTSPTEPPSPTQQASCPGHAFPLIHEPHLSTSSTCSCSVEHQGALDLDANCNSYLPPHSGLSGDLASCLQSQARLVVATQNYYKLVTCDLSSQSSPSPAPSSVNSCSDEHSRGSPTPTQPSEYFLFRQEAGQSDVNEEDERRPSPQKEKNNEEEEEEKMKNQAAGGAGAPSPMIQGQVYVNTSPPVIGRNVIGGACSGSRPRSRSYDRNLDKSPSPRLGSLERMLSCPVRLSEGTSPAPPPPPRVTSFAEIARSKRRNGGAGGSPSSKVAADLFSSTYSAHSHSSVDFSPILEQRVEAERRSLSPVTFTRCYSHGSMERHLEAARESHTEAEGVSTSSHCPPVAVVRYSRDQRPTSLPIQPFTFHHQFTCKAAQCKPVLPPLSAFVSGMQTRGDSASSPGSGSDPGSGGPVCEAGKVLRTADPPPALVRPSPLGSYTPVRLQGASSSETSSQPPSPPHDGSLSALLAPPHTPLQAKQGARSAPLPQNPPPSLTIKRGAVPQPLTTFHCGAPPPLSPLSYAESGKHGGGARTHNAHHLSPQALKWREYRRQNPLSVERVCGSNFLCANAEPQRAAGPRPSRRNVFDFPTAPSSCRPGQLHGAGSSVKSDFLPDYFSLSEKPPEEFCLSPDTSSSSLSSSSSQSYVSVDLTQKRALVKAVNRAVDLIVAHFSTSRDADVKAKLGNSCVSPNVGHLILKYLCPALCDVLQDGLKAFVLDLIVGQRRCRPWTLVETSTQLGPSTRVLHTLFSKVSQFSELSSATMRMNAFIFGLLNLKSLEFWFSHLHTHEDIIAAHYNPWGFLPLSQGPFRLVFQELLLLLQPLSLLPFDLDLLFEPHLLQKGAEHMRCKEQLCSAGQRVDQSARSTFQLMRGWSATVSEMVRNTSGETKAERAGLRREGTWPRMEGARSRRRMEGAGSEETTGERRETGVGQEERRSRKEGEESEEGRQRRQAGWWYQLMQSSQVYIDKSNEKTKFIKKSTERRRGQAPPTREGVVEGAESRPEGEGFRSSSEESCGQRRRPSWMGSPPESVLSPTAPPAGPETSCLRWSRLFGSSPWEGPGLRGRGQKTRPPSGWLALDRSVLDLVVHTIGAGSGKKAEPPTAVTHIVTPPQQPEAKQPSPCEVRALCHHIATERGQLSFNKGDVLRVISRAHPDWLLCSLGSTHGLVPIVYVTLNNRQDNLEDAAVKLSGDEEDV
ncbi:iporin isoform X1 [Solea senegalensis]|uniref:Iporin isoform X1 n=1 Tax=Solea senegalensis TaxID=28829 RepID=A0AAV6QGT4_SOLSE|nr:iporin isoform X1 [Solea senegalensis]KAG7489343.1 iporin isoform X1 [Solea senegalensis]